ncbi:MAG TPA: hypothetical protein VIM23_04665 [Gaiellaceae bacterium]|jgi:hypothetical protein
MTRQSGTGETKKGQEGRQARTRGVSLAPDEATLTQEFEELTGLGFTDQVRQSLLAKLPAAVALLKDMREAGMEPGKPLVVDQVVYAETADERRELYEDTYEPVEAREEIGVG